MTDLDRCDRSALRLLLASAIETSAAVGGWWETPGGTAILLDGTEPGADGPDVRRHDAAIDGRCYARLALRAAQRSAADLAPVLCPAAALLRARAQALATQFKSDRMRDAVRTATDWLWETDADGRVVWMTDSISTLTGRNASEEVGTLPMDVNRVRTDEYAASYDRYLVDRAARRPIRELVLDRDTPNGTITVSISGEPRFGPDGVFLGYRGATRNITEEVRAREEARRATSLLQHALEGLPAGVMISGPDGRILLANQRWRESIGLDLPAGCDRWADVIRHHVAVGNYPEAQGREDEYIGWRLSLASTTPTPVELRWRDRWALAADQRLPDGNIVHLSFDVTDRKRAELALAVAEDRWRFAMDSAAHGVWDWERGRELYVSPSWKKMVGYGEDEPGASPREWYSQLHPDDAARVLADVRRHVRGETEAYEIDYRLRRRGGGYLWIHDRGRAIQRDRHGRPMRMVGTQSDITRLREADTALRERQAAQMANRRTSEFLSRMSHEIRTPLNAVIGFAELLQADADFRADRIGHILAAGRHLMELVNDVLDLQQVEHGNVTLQVRGLSAHAIVRAVDAMLGPAAESAQVERLIEGFDGVAVVADEQRLRQVLLNLGSNAIKYNRPAGTLRWSVDGTDPARWGLVVEDTGRGLEAAHLKRLFQPFERLGHETSAIPGSGLGLVIARRLVEVMGGKLVVASQPGLGTRVTVWLPRARATAPSDPEVGSPDDVDGPGLRPGARHHILYVEDNPVNALLFSEALRGHGQLVLRVAENGPQALDIAREWLPDLLVIDMHLPGPDGAEVLRRLRELPGLSAVPAVVCSADALPADRRRARNLGFVDYWTKPLDVLRLPQAIAQALRGRPLA